MDLSMHKPHDLLCPENRRVFLLPLMHCYGYGKEDCIVQKKFLKKKLGESTAYLRSSSSLPSDWDLVSTVSNRGITTRSTAVLLFFKEQKLISVTT